jgi:hypothetical protein
MPIPVNGDGCIVPNIPTKNYIVYMAPRCAHKKVRGAYIAVRAESAQAAFDYAGDSIRIAGLAPASVTEVTGAFETYAIPAPIG